jgi:hypothetical protein
LFSSPNSLGGGGPGAWVIGISGAITSYVAILAYRRRSDASITTVVDLIGFGPTFRTAYLRPHDERAWFYGLAAVRNLLVVIALDFYSLTTVLFPAAIDFGCLVLTSLIAYRKHAFKNAR